MQLACKVATHLGFHKLPYEGSTPSSLTITFVISPASGRLLRCRVCNVSVQSDGFVSVWGTCGARSRRICAANSAAVSFARENAFAVCTRARSGLAVPRQCLRSIGPFALPA
jgi:hypothetical protein